MNKQPTILVCEHFEKETLEKISKKSVVIDYSKVKKKNDLFCLCATVLYLYWDNNFIVA